MPSAEVQKMIPQIQESFARPYVDHDENIII